ncbi:MBL fold metallo-hydrolase [Radiobacillus kanasensis]|uniref:MBL fold metallo-hydrolase n=1 Tax=Radiobacillus kanasensis TaxID=2844358 RepID=UPI001E5D5ADD|nr:MBL fold metallo-hydrolase [Radiobacillus kanasensis]UFT97773.1 MBL fold metallo-hydrolase [Radiobacillus kanasensis]
MEIKTLPLGPLGTNCYVAIKEGKALILDPGGDAPQLLNFLNNHQLKPVAVLLTHAHFDHIGAVDEVCSTFQIDVHLHTLEWDWLVDANKNGSGRFIGNEIIVKSKPIELTDDHYSLDGFDFRITSTPGHSPGSVSVIFEDEQIVFSGDALFQQGIGRTDLLQGDMEQLLASIRTQLFVLDDAYTVYPGHGPSTSIGFEKKHNPFLND